MPDVRDRNDLLERLADLYKETGRDREAEVTRTRMERPVRMKREVDVLGDGKVLREKQAFTFGEKGMPLEEFQDFEKELRHGRKPETKPGKVGRNSPCPCGSGKKYKRCCGR